MGRSIRYLLIFLVTLLVTMGWNVDSVCAAETVRTGTLGVNNGIKWEYNEGTKTLTVSGTDTWSNDESFYYICYNVEYIVFKDCCIKGQANSLFEFLIYLKEVDLSGLEIPDTTNLYWMFRGCSSLTSLDLSGFDTGKVTSMYGMFRDCRSLTALDLSGFDTGNVVGMSEMFYGCSNLKSLELSSLNTSNVTNMSSMFEGCSSLTSLNLGSFNTENVVNMSSMFAGCSSLKSLNLGGFNTENVANMSSMLEGCSSLTSLDLSGLNTENVVDMSSMFASCSSLKSLNLSGLNTVNVIDMNSMFYGCNSLKSLNLSGLNTAKVTNMNSLFSGCSSLTSLDLSGINTANVTGMISMFSGCKNLANLDLSELNTDKVKNMASIFSNCSSLKSLDLSGLNTANVTDMRYMFSGCSGLTSLNLSGFNTGKVTNMWAMFSGCSSLTGLDLSSLDTSRVTDMASMFSGCSSLTGIDVSDFDTRNVTYMNSMFAGCKSLTSLDLTGFSTANVTSMYSMFSGCTNLKNLNLKGINTAKVKNMESMFANCNSLNRLDFSSFDTSNVTNMKSMFYHCHNLSTLDLSGFDTSNVTNMYNMFMTCTNLNSLNLSGLFDTSNVTSMTQMFAYCYGLTALDVSKFNTSKVNSMYAMFRGCSSLANLDLSSFDTSNVTDMRRMFEMCENLSDVYLSNFDTSKIEGTDYMFFGCGKLPYLDLSNFDTSKVTSTASMFSGCKALEVVRVPKAMAEGQVMNLPQALKDADGNTVTQISETLCGTTLSKYFLQISMAKTELIEEDNLQLVLKLDNNEQPLSDNTKYSWSSSAKDVATVSEKGIIKAIGAGTATITCTKEKGPIATCKVTVVEKVSITGQPTSRSVVEGNNAVFTVTAKGSNLSYRWQYKLPEGSTWVNSGMTGAKTASLTVQGTMGRNGQQYRCIITDGSGNKVTSNAVTLTVTEKLAITSQPVSKSVEEGNNAVFTVTAKGSNLSYRWQYRAVGTDEWKASGITGAKTASLTVAGEIRRNGQQYRCVITDGRGNKVTSNAVTLTVTEKLTITSQPVNISMVEGNNAVFTVKAKGHCLSYQWQYKNAGADKWLNSGMTGAKTGSLTVQGTIARNGQQYRCVITDGRGNKVTSNAVTLTVTEKLTITGQPASQTVAEGMNAVFKVTAKGSNLSYQWQYKAGGTKEWKASGMTGAKTASLTVQGLAVRNGQQYRCIITDGSGNQVTSNAVTLTVEEKLSITGQPASQTVAEGMNAVFKVTAKGSNLSYQWQYKAVGTKEWKASGMTGAKTGSLTVQGTMGRNGQQYRCIITDGSGNQVTSNAVTLTVEEKLSITGQPASQTVAEGMNAVFKVTAKGSSLSYQWQYKLPGGSTWSNSGITGAKTDSLTVQGIMVRNGQQYRCIITDGNGNKVTSNAVTLTVTEKLAITSQPVNQSVAEGANAVFKVTAKGMNLSYQWQYKNAGTDKWFNSGMAGAKTASLTVQGTAARNGQQYRCIITDGSGNTVTSNAATLTVSQ